MSRHPDAGQHIRARSRKAFAIDRGGKAVGFGLLAFAGVRLVQWLGKSSHAAVKQDAMAEKDGLLAAERLARARAEQACEAADAARRVAEESNEAKGKFCAVMGHEFRTPLNAIVGHVQLVQLGVHGPVTVAQQEAFERIQRAGRHLLGLVNEVLDHARLEAGRVEYSVEEVDLCELVESASAFIEPQRQAKRQSLTVTAPPSPCIVWADADRLRQVVVNLLANAVKFTPEGGAITVDFDTPSSTPDAACVRIADTGAGIPLDRMEAIFAPFVRLATGGAAHQEGTGLGLAISRDYARGMGGDITVAPASGQGTIFSVSLRRVVVDPGVRTDRRFHDARHDAGDRRHPPDRRLERP